MILVVDDDAAVCWAMRQALAEVDFQVETVAGMEAAVRAVRRRRPGLVISDLRMPGRSGLELLAWMRAHHQEVPTALMSAYCTLDVVADLRRRGACDVLAKPIDLERLLALARSACGLTRAALRRTPDEPVADESMIGSSPPMQQVYRRLAAAAASDLAVLVTGSSGTGKELVARALHRHGRRRAGPFVAVNCGALPEHLVEGELFGHAAGAFTGAQLERVGRIESAAGGTLFLDEVGELAAPAQAKLLRFLDQGTVQRVGTHQERAVDVRVVAATNRDLETLVLAGLFRADLAFRLRVLGLHRPDLAERSGDVPQLVTHLLGGIARRLDRAVGITAEALDLLAAYSWPGNVRQLKHVLEEAAVFAADGVITPRDLAALHSSPVNAEAQLASGLARLVAEAGAAGHGRIWQSAVDRAERVLFQTAVRATQGNYRAAADLLGIHRTTLTKRGHELVLEDVAGESPAPADDKPEPPASVR